MSAKGGSGGAKGHTSKHVASKKHVVHHRAKHSPKHKKQAHHVHHKPHVHVKGKGNVHPVIRGYAVGDLLPVCAFEAVAMSLRLAGQRVAEDDLMELWWLAGSREVSIAEALDAAARFGLAGCRPSVWGGCEDLKAMLEPVTETEDGVVRHELVIDLVAAVPRARASHALILGVDRPGPHTVLATPDGWWSWGTLWSPWTARIEEAWAVSWS